MKKTILYRNSSIVAAFVLILNVMMGTIVAQEPQKKTILFVCEHGVAKSILAAAHFNRLAQERKIPYTAIARSTAPQDSLIPSIMQNMRSEGLAAPEKPAPKLSQTDCDAAVQRVFFCPIPASYRMNAATKQWQNIPPVSEQYQAARDSMVTKIRDLLDELSIKQPSQKDKR